MWSHAVHRCGQRHPSAQADSHHDLCGALHEDFMMIAKAHMRGLWEEGGFSDFFSLGMSHCRFPPLFHTPGISTWLMWLVPVMPARSRNAISGILAGGDPGFRHCDFFALAPVGSSGNVFLLFSCWFQRIDWFLFCVFFVVCSFLLFLVFFLLCVFCLFADGFATLFYASGTASYSYCTNTGSLLQYRLHLQKFV